MLYVVYIYYIYTIYSMHVCTMQGPGTSRQVTSTSWLAQANFILNYGSFVTCEFHDRRINESKVMRVGLSLNSCICCSTAHL